MPPRRAGRHQRPGRDGLARDARRARSRARHPRAARSPRSRPSRCSTFNQPDVRAVGVPGGGGVSTAADLALFYQALLHDPLAMWKPDVLADVDGDGAQHVPRLHGDARQPDARPRREGRRRDARTCAGWDEVVGRARSGTTARAVRSRGPTPTPACRSASSRTASTSTSCGSGAAARRSRTAAGGVRGAAMTRLSIRGARRGRRRLRCGAVRRRCRARRRERHARRSRKVGNVTVSNQTPVRGGEIDVSSDGLAARPRRDDRDREPRPAARDRRRARPGQGPRRGARRRAPAGSTC